MYLRFQHVAFSVFDIMIDFVLRVVRECHLACPYDGRTHRKDGAAHPLVHPPHTVPQVLDKEGFDDRLQHRMGEISKPPQDNDHVGNLWIIIPSRNNHDDNNERRP